MFHIRVRLRVPGTGEIVDRFLVATNEENAPRQVFTHNEAIGFVSMTMGRGEEFQAVEVVPATPEAVEAARKAQTEEVPV